MRSPLQKISGEQARMKRQWGYFKIATNKVIAELSIRLSELESLLRVGSDDPSHPEDDGPSGPKDALSTLDCSHCALLIDRGLPPALVRELHNAAHPPARQTSVYESG